MCTQLFDPKVDYVFKHLFGNEQHPNILLSFLNACIKPKDPIVSVQIKNTELNKEYVESSFSRLDILAKTDTGELINVEMQRLDEHNMVKRSLYYWAKTYIHEYQGGSRYRELPRTICINVLDFNLLRHKAAYHNYYWLKDQDNELLTDVLELHFIELPKMLRLDDSDLLTLWVAFLQDPNHELMIHAERNLPALTEAREELARISRDPAQAEHYRMRENAHNDRMNALLSSEDKGIQKGLQQGLEQGAMKAKLELAKKLLAKGFDIAAIVELTGLSSADLAAMQA